MATLPFENNFWGILLGLSLGARVPNLKFVSSTVLELLAFNRPPSKKNLRGHVTLAMPPFTLF